MEKTLPEGRFAFDTACTEREYARAMRIAALRVGSGRFWPLVALASAALLLGDIQAVVLHSLTLTSPLSLWLLGAAVMLPALCAAALWRQLQTRLCRAWPLYTVVGVRRHCVSYSGGLIFSTPCMRRQLPFVDCRMLVEKKEFFLIIENKRSFVLLPKRDIPEQQRQAFSDFLHHAFIRGRAFGR